MRKSVKTTVKAFMTFFGGCLILCGVLFFVFHDVDPTSWTSVIKLGLLDGAVLALLIWVVVNIERGRKREERKATRAAKKKARCQESQPNSNQS